MCSSDLSRVELPRRKHRHSAALAAASRRARARIRVPRGRGTATALAVAAAALRPGASLVPAFAARHAAAPARAADRAAAAGPRDAARPPARRVLGPAAARAARPGAPRPPAAVPADHRRPPRPPRPPPFPTPPLFRPTLSGLPSDRSNVYLTLTAGWPSPAGVPHNLKQAIRLLVGHWYENREAATAGGVSAEIQFGVDTLISPFRSVR